MATPTPRLNATVSSRVAGGAGRKGAGVSSRAKAAVDPLKDIKNFGQSVIDVISTPLYAVEGFANEVGLQAKKGNSNVIDILTKGVQAGDKYANAWKTGGKRITGTELLVNLGVIPDSKFGNVKIGEFDINLPGLAADIALDPLTYVPGGIFVTAAKAPVIAGKSALKGFKVASTTGEISASVALRKATDEAAKAAVGTAKAGQEFRTVKPVKSKFTAGWTPERLDLAEATAKASQVTGEALTKLERIQVKAAKTVKAADPSALAYKTLQLGDTPLNTVSNQLASAFEAAKSGLVATIVTDSAKRRLRKLNPKEASLIRRGAESSIPVTSAIGLARQAENAAVKAGESALVMEDGSVIGIKPNTTFIDADGGAHVWDGKNVRSWTDEDAAYNAASANSYLDSLTVKPAERLTIEGRPIVDSAPTPRIMEQLKNIKSPDAEVKATQKMLKMLDTISKNTVGRAVGGDNVAYKIRQIVDSVDPEKTRFFSNLRPEVKNALQAALKGANGRNVFDFIRKAAESGEKQVIDLANEILNLVITGANGRQATIRDIFNGVANFNDLSREARTDIINSINKLVFEGSDANALAGLKMSEISALVNGDVAKAIAKTGALRTDKATDEKALQAILDGIKATPGVSEKAYGGYDDLIAGLKADDQIETAVLEKILTIIDPEGALVEQVKKLADNELNSALSNILTRQGMQLVSDARRRLEILDASRILEAEGLGLHESISSYLQLRLAGEFPPAGNATLESRQAAADTITRLFEGNSAESQLLRRVLTSAGTAIDARFEEIMAKIASSKNATEFISSYGDASMRSTTKAFEENSKAINYLQTNQSFSTKLVGSVLGIMREDAKRKVTGAVNRGATPAQIAASKSDQLDKFITTMSLANSTFLGVLGARFMTAKQVKQGGKKHFAYLDLGDVADVVKTLGGAEGRDVMMRALFPNTKTKTDGLSYIGMTDAVRMILEGRELNKIPTLQEVSARIKSVGSEQAEWSDEFKNTNPQKTADDLAAILLRADVIEAFEDLHKTRAIAEVEDLLGEVITLTEDVMQSLADGFYFNKLAENMADGARRAAIREAFAKFAFAAGFMEQKNGAQAKSMMEIASLMFIKDGRMLKIREAREFLDNKVLPEDQAELDRIVGTIDTMYQYDNPYRTAPVGRENIKAPTKAAQDKALFELEKYKGAFYEHITKGLEDVKTPDQVATWNKKYDELLGKLDKARTVALKNHLETQHWDGEKWIDSRFYNHAAALQKARNSADRFKLVGDTQVDMGPRMVDVKPLNPGTKLNQKQSKALVKTWVANANKRSVELADGSSQDAAQHAIDVYGMIERQAPDAFWAALRVEQERIAFKYSQIDEVVDIPDVNKMEYAGTYAGQKNARKAGFDTSSRIGTALGRFNAGTNAESVSILRNAQSQGFKAKNKISVITRKLSEQMDKLDLKPFMDDLDDFGGDLLKTKQTLRNRAFSRAFNYGLRNELPPAELGERFVEVAKLLGRLITGVKAQLASLNMDPKIVDRYMKKYGLDAFEGFNAPSSYKNPAQFADAFLNDLPFSENPYQAGDISGTIFAENKARFEAAAKDPFMMFSNLVFALIDAKTEQVFVNDFISQFGYKAAGISMKKAIEQGRVSVKALPGDIYDLSAHLIGKESEGALFDPVIAKQFANLNREWAYMQSKEMKPFLRYLMDFTGILKTTQTVLRPGHVMTNVIGDTFNSFVLGARQYKHWANALRLSKDYMVGRVKEEGIFYMPGNTEAALETSIQGLARLGKNPEAALKEGQKATYTAVIGGKKVELDRKFLLQLAEDTGTANDNIINTDIQGLFESVQARSLETGARGRLAKSMYAKMKNDFDKGVKPAGDITAYYSNIPRIASMLSVIDRKAWTSIDEMKRAITDDIALYHPSIFSLTATERMYPRAIFTYYTWLRVAHNALIDMALNHTAAITLYPKVQSSAAEQAGYEPVSLGNAWGVNKQMTPQYLNYSTYAPMGEEGPRGPVLFKPALLPMDVLDTWNWSYDPSKSFDQNVFGVINSIGRVIGRSTNIVATPAVEWMTGTDLSTGKATQIKDLQTFGDEIINNTGYAGILKGLGVWTPTNKRPENTSNPITERDQQLYRENWTFGLKRQDIGTLQNQKAARTEQSAKLRELIDKLIQETDNGRQ